MRKLSLLAVLVAMLLALPLSAFAGVGGPAFYVDGDLYRTVGTPTDFSDTGAPTHSYDTIYQFFGAQPYNVATAAPGDPGFNGGRWQVEGIEYVGEATYGSALAMFDANQSGDFDSAAEVEAAIDAGVITTHVVKSFECPVIPLPQGPN
ncbi:MAG: hypothetical protein WB239_01030 [Acidimicrobiia bacterium]